MDVSTNGIHLHVVQAGPTDGPLTILLHGFPEFWYGWRKQIDYLAERGFWVWAVDQRGYNTSDKPQGIAAYNLDLLSADLTGLIDAAGKEAAFVVGHDWGGEVAWWTANKSPERIKKMVILNVPHHRAFRKHLATSWHQRRKSWYMSFFQIPWLPDRLLTMNGSTGLGRVLRRTSNPGTFTDADLAEYYKAWSQPGAMTGMLNWYRAIVQNPPQRLPDSRIHVPTLLLWGKKDSALDWEMAQPSIDLCDDGRLVYFENATHWVQHEEAEQVNHYIGEFLR
jgi:epoxide hydrolase 4